MSSASRSATRVEKTGSESPKKTSAGRSHEWSFSRTTSIVPAEG